MATSKKFREALAFVLKSEGGSVDDPRDAGGRTSQGVTQEQYTRWLKYKNLPWRDVWSIPQEHVEQLFWDFYWEPMKCEGMPLPVAYVAFDTSVLHGVNFAPKVVQKSLNVLADGILGKMTLAAANAIDPRLFEQRVREHRWARMQTRPSFPTFGKGWKKRLDDVSKNVKSLTK